MGELVHLRLGKGHNRTTVRRAVYALAAALSGHGSEFADMARTVQAAVGAEALRIIQEAYLVKSKGGTDAAGDRWAELAVRTIEGRLRRLGSPTRAGAMRGVVLAAEKLQRTRKGSKGRERALRGYQRAQEKAGKAFGPLDILNAGGRLYESLTPGDDGPGNAEGQVFDLRPGSVEVGTSDPNAQYHHGGTKRMPQRRLWPELSKWPPEWHRRLASVYREAFVRVVIAALTGGA